MFLSQYICKDVSTTCNIVVYFENPDLIHPPKEKRNHSKISFFHAPDKYCKIFSSPAIIHRDKNICTVFLSFYLQLCKTKAFDDMDAPSQFLTNVPLCRYLLLQCSD